MKTFQKIGTDVGALVERKNKAYGSSFEKAGAFLALLYPEGIAPEQMADALVLVRIFDKQMRIATDRDALGESPYSDITGYGILGVAMHQQGKEPAPCPGSASDQAAAETSKAPAASATTTKISTAKKTSPSDAKSSDSKRSPSPRSSSANTSDEESISTAYAHARIARTPAAAGSSSEAVQPDQRRNLSLLKWRNGSACLATFSLGWILAQIMADVQTSLFMTTIFGINALAWVTLWAITTEPNPEPREFFFDKEPE